MRRIVDGPARAMISGSPRTASRYRLPACATATAVLLLPFTSAVAQEGVSSAVAQAEDLAQQLANPIASLVSVPLQYNYDSGFGLEGDGKISRLNIQPVVPFSIGEDWNLITRTIIPLIDQQDFPARGLGESGLGDVVASQFFSPKAPTSSGWTWGAGPVWLLPTASDDLLGTGKFGLGPTAVALKQIGPWTLGGLANHIWSVAGDDDRAEVNATFLQPFGSYIFQSTKTTLSVSSEATYDWVSDSWTLPVAVSVGQMLKIGPQILQITAGPRYWVESPNGGPDGWGWRLTLTLLYPQNRR